MRVPSRPIAPGTDSSVPGEVLAAEALLGVDTAPPAETADVAPARSAVEIGSLTTGGTPRA